MAFLYPRTTVDQQYFLWDSQSQSVNLFKLLLCYRADGRTWMKLSSSAYINSQLPAVGFVSLWMPGESNAFHPENMASSVFPANCWCGIMGIWAQSCAGATLEPPVNLGLKKKHLGILELKTSGNCAVTQSAHAHKSITRRQRHNPWKLGCFKICFLHMRMSCFPDGYI